MKKVLFAVAFLAVMCALSNLAEAVEYRLHELPLPASLSYAQHACPLYINNVGQVLGEVSMPDEGTHICLWENGVPSDRGQMSSMNIGEVNIIDGHVVVQGWLGGGTPQLWTDGVMTGFGSFGTGKRLYIDGMNNNGQFAGTLYDASTDEWQACVWQDGLLTNLYMYAAIRTNGFDINNQGQVIGSYMTRSTYPYEHACLWENGTGRDLGTLGGKWSEAYDLNEQGQVVGRSITATGDRYVGFIWQNGKMTALYGFPGFQTVAVAVNNSGIAVGYADMSNYGDQRAAVWQDGVMTVLHGLDGYSSQAYDINDNGWICGRITTRDGRTHAVLWEPVPEPSSILALLSGLGGFGLVLRRRVGRG